MRTVIGFTAASVVFGLAALAAAAEEKESKVDVDDLPKAIVEAIREEFDDAEITAAEQGTDDGETFYEVEIKEEGDSLDVVLDEEGEIEEIAEEMEADDLPKAVTAALKEKYPRAKIKEAEKVTEYEDEEEEDEAKSDDDEDGDKEDDDGSDKKGGKEDAEDDDDGDDEDEEGEVSYEVEIVTADGKTLEVEVSADGKEVEVEAGGDDGEEADDDDKDADDKKGDDNN